uniref:RNase H type-1 domain-containing protein n=1 Tax=Eutreptiella gymnastica TaxID=73025 RepID=A0A7S1J5D0_9EUGL|mmetsp:Transcript_68196/g.120637  ORF Transcript_68196/g.120637 Transcript_68196/m.120637 type:complete len:135 (+) Transcript_68196:1298-1702(+)
MTKFTGGLWRLVWPLAPKKHAHYVPLGEQQHVVWIALQHKQPLVQLCIALDAKMVYHGVTQWMNKWRRHGWVVVSDPVGYSDLWQQIYASVILHCDSVLFVPSHVDNEGNEQAEKFTKNGHVLHPNNEETCSTR